MCGRTACALEPRDVTRALGKDVHLSSEQWKHSEQYKKSWNKCTYRASPVIVHDDDVAAGAGAGGRRDAQPYARVEVMRWGVETPYMKSLNKKLVNARSETILEKKTFAKLMGGGGNGGRCVVLCNGYYEWYRNYDGKAVVPPSPLRRGGRSKKAKFKPQPYYITPSEGAPGAPVMAIAGLHQLWQDPHDGEWKETYLLITTAASDATIAVHDRMPAILRPDEIERWLNPATPLREARELLRPTTNVTMRRVGYDVGNVKNDGEYLIAPYVEPEVKQNSISSMFMRGPKKPKKEAKEAKEVKAEAQGQAKAEAEEEAKAEAQGQGQEKAKAEAEGPHVSATTATCTTTGAAAAAAAGGGGGGGTAAFRQLSGGKTRAPSQPSMETALAEERAEAEAAAAATAAAGTTGAKGAKRAKTSAKKTGGGSPGKKRKARPLAKNPITAFFAPKKKRTSAPHGGDGGGGGGGGGGTDAKAAIVIE